ncbi:MAG: tetraacyldisaccharide 4'-kinase [Gemmatimonadaceae bacterium]
MAGNAHRVKRGTLPRLFSLQRVWWGEGPQDRAIRLALLPLSLAYRGAISLRNGMYDRGLLRSHAPALPAISVGNLSSGGTGKTPIAAWIASELSARGAHPAIVTRGYGEDEPFVHQILNPTVPVVVDPDRLAGIASAAAIGADIAVLDDAFQHRRVKREADVVLLSADRWPKEWRALPAGPWREPLEALRRASLAIVVRKAVTLGQAREVVDFLQRTVPNLRVAVAHLGLGSLREWGGNAVRTLASLRGVNLLAISAIGDPESFIDQLRVLGTDVRPENFPDHFAFTRAEADRLASALEQHQLPVCTLKDAVKLGPLWPREAPSLWYVSQHVAIEEGMRALEVAFESVLQARSISLIETGRAPA